MWPAERACRRRRAAVLLPFVAAALALVGCTALGLKGGDDPATAPASESALYLEAVRGLIGQGQYYAAIAHIEEDRRRYGDTPELRLLEADARRKLQQNKSSESLYQSVIRGNSDAAMAGKARHGLGLLYAPVNLTAALKELREAARLRPTDPDIRSDYGYALMQMRRFSEAKMELSTAHELSPTHVAARNNLLILFYALGDEAAAGKLAARASFDAKRLAPLKAQAQSFKTPKPTPTRTGAPPQRGLP